MINEFGDKFISVKSKPIHDKSSSFSTPKESSVLLKSSVSNLNEVKEIQQYKSSLRTKRVFENFNQQLAAQVQTNQSDQRTLQNLKKTQDYMFDHFERSMSRKSAYRVINKPDYLSHFKYKKDPEIEDTFIAIKNGDYDLDKEEVQLTKLMKDIRTKTSQQINRQLKKIGVLNYTPEKKRSDINQVDNYNNNAMSIFSHYQTTEFPMESKMMMMTDNSRLSQLGGRAGTTSPKPNIDDIKHIIKAGQHQRVNTHHQESRNIRTFVVQDQKNMTHTNDLKQPKHTSFSTDFREQNTQPMSTRVKPKLSIMSTYRRDKRHDESTEQVIKSPFQNQLIRDIWDKSIAEELSTNATTHNLNQGIRYLRQEQEKLKDTLEVIKQVQEGDNGISLMEASEQNQFLKDSNQRNFLDKQVIDQMKEENFKNSVFIRYLKGTTGGNNRLNLVWKPNKFTFTKIGPKLDESLYQQEK